MEVKKEKEKEKEIAIKKEERDMGPYSDSAVNFKQIKTEVHDAAQEQRRRLLEEIMQDDSTGNDKSGRKASKLQVFDRGQIASMSLLPDFVKGKTIGGTYANNSFQEYHLKSNANVKIYFEYRGSRMGDESAKAFKDILAKPPHMLSTQELEGLHQVLGTNRSNGDNFEISSAKTEDLLGKRVVLIEGYYPKHGLSARTIFVDTDGTGSAVQEITFQAPKAEFIKNSASSLKAFESIKWK